MTTPAMPPVPPTGSNNNGPVNGNLGGATGTLLGANVLQQSIDQLTRAVNNLAGTMSTTNVTGGVTPGSATRQQNVQGAGGFPRMINPFQANVQQQGIGGGGPGGAGNISAPSPFGRFAGPMMMASALTSFGQQQMNPLLSLNQYATSSMIGLNTNGMSRGQAMQAMYRQAGFSPNNLNALGLSPTDLLNAMPALQQRAGSMLVRGTPIGRATLGAQSAFGMMNPTLGASASAQMAAALYSPQFSLNMMTMGYRPILSQRPGGAPMNAGQAAQSILAWMGLNKMNASQVFGNLSSGVGQANLSALFGPSGISNQTASQFLTGYSQLFAKGLNPSQATQLFQQASSGNLASMKAAQARLNQLGIATSANDIQAMKNAQAVTTGREGIYAQGFDQGIQQATGLLSHFNQALTNLLKTLGLGGVLGQGGAFGGIMAGTSHAVGSLGTVGGLLTLGRMFGLGGGGAAAGAAGAGGLGAAAAIGGAATVGAGLGVAGVALQARYGRTVAHSLGIYHAFGLGSNSAAAERQAIMNSPNLSAATKAHLLHLITLEDQGVTLNTGQQNQIARAAGMGGGAIPGSAKGTTQSRTGGNNMSSISGSAKKAVSAAESQVGVPYEWGAELPGVGFDCSALVQWAYKQAGVSLPRTSQEQWSALKKRSVPLNAVQEGDLVFTAGSDGSGNSPGHVGLMINSRQLVQAPYSGADVQIVGYDPKAWQHAARPSGSGSFISGTSGMPQATPIAGNRGLALGRGLSGTYGSVNEVDVISAMGSSGAGGSRISNGSSGRSNTVTGGGSTPANVPRNARQIAALAQRMAAQYGWASGVQWADFVNIVNHEDASWSPTAVNPNGGAYGIPQALPGSKMASAGPDWRTNPATQLKWMFGYIGGRYGTPSNAWAHEQAVGWYGAGGATKPGWAIVGDRGPELMYQGGGNQVFSNAQTMQLINAIKGAAPAQSPWKTDVTSGHGPSASSSRMMNVTFSQGSIVIQGSGNGLKDAANTGREVARQVIKHLDNEAVHAAIRNGEKF